MKNVAAKDVAAALRALGIGAGETLLCHSAVQFLGRPEGGLVMYLDAIQSVLGPEGTLAVPAFNFGFARGEPFDPVQTPAEGMGAFSEFVRRRPEARRTPHPLQSLAVFGRHALDLAARDTPSAFDPGSAFERLLELDGRLLLLGADVQAASIVHYCEQRACVPYRYWKTFSGLVNTPAGWQTRSYRMYARDLQLDPQLDLRPVQRELTARRQWRAVPLNYGRVSACSLRAFVAAAGDLLAADPWALVANPPDSYLPSS